MRALAAVAAAFALLLFGMPGLAPLFARAFPDVVPPIYGFASFPSLTLAHAELVAAAAAAAVATALAAGVFVTREWGRPFRSIIGAVATIGQTCPPVAVLAVAVPVLGYGALPTFVALALAGFLPVVTNVIAGIEGVPENVREAAVAMGLAPRQILFQVELPLAAPVILAGVRVSIAIMIGTATIGSTVGAVTLGTPIIDGLIGDKLPYVIEGASVAALLAILIDLVLEQIAARFSARTSRSPPAVRPSPP